MPFEYGKMSWDDIRLFLAVANAGGLTAAVPETGLSAPTLNRRISEFEKALAVPLFVRGAKGYVLTAAGQDLRERVLPMADQARGVTVWREGLDPRPKVRIACGYWTGIYIARNLKVLQASLAGAVRLDILSGAGFLNLSRREADLAVRNVLPTQQGLARRRIGRVDFAVYGAPQYIIDHPDAKTPLRSKTCDWVVPNPAAATGASTRWLLHYLDHPAAVSCDTPHALMAAACGGAGLCVLPCFVGEGSAQLQRCSDAIEGLSHTQWLVSHDVSRKERPIKRVGGALYDLFARDQALWVI